MDLGLRLLDRVLCLFTRLLLRLALSIEEMRLRIPRRLRRWRRGLRGFYRRWLARDEPPTFIPRRRSANRTPDYIEEQVVRLHIEQPLLGTGQLRRLAQRVLGFHACRETFRKILIRRRDLLAALIAEKRKQRRRIVVRRALALWGADLTLVWVLGFIPVWILGVVDYHGSRLVAFERLPWPTASAIARVLERAIAEHGVPERILTDRAPVLRAPVVADLLELHGIEHTLTRPAHASASTSSPGTTATGRTAPTAARRPTRSTSPGPSSIALSDLSRTSTAASTGTAWPDDRRRPAVSPAPDL